MIDWIAANSEPLNLLSNLGMLLVWLVYLQAALSGYRRQRRASILINRGVGSGIDARCLVTNMSAEVIYIERVFAEVTIDGKTRQDSVTELEGLEAEGALSRLSMETRQGPLKVGEIIDIGSFRSIVEHVARRGDGAEAVIDPASVTAITVEIAADYGSEDLPVGACRRFAVRQESGTPAIGPGDPRTRQIRSRAARRRLRAALAADR